MRRYDWHRIALEVLADGEWHHASEVTRAAVRNVGSGDSGSARRALLQLAAAGLVEAEGDWWTT